MVTISTHDRNVRADALQATLFREIERTIPEADQDVFLLLKQAEDDPQGVVAQLADASPSKIDTFNKYYNLQHTIRSYTPILMTRAHEGEHGEAFAELETAIYALKAAGYSLEQAIEFLKEIKISKSGTPHPTEGLSKDGIALCRELVAAAEQANPDFAIEAVIKKMVAADNIGASAKNGILDEIDADVLDSRIHNEGAYILNKHVQKVLIDAYKPQGKDLEDVKSLVLDIGRRSWKYDSDGKNNAEGWAMMAGLATSKFAVLSDIETTLLDVKTKHPNLFNEEHATLLSDIQTVKGELEKVLKKSRDMTQVLAENPEKRQQIYEENYAAYQATEKQFGQIYDDIGSKNRGWDFYHTTHATLADLRETLYEAGDENLGDSVDRGYIVLKQNGFALDKAQPRQNDIIHARIIDNLFQHPAFRARGILSADEISEIDRAGGISHLEDKARQEELRQKVIAYADENGNRDEILADLFDANPLKFNQGNGFPDQERTLLDRFKIRKLFPAMFDQGIISDCSEYGPARQKFIADLFGLETMKHMPLHEDRMNLTRQGELLRGIYSRAVGPTRQKIRDLINETERLAEFLGGRGVHETHVMRPASDSEKGGGSGTRQEAIDVYRKIVRLSLEVAEESGEAVPLEIMIGGGMSMQRYGGDPEIVRSVVEQELKQYALRRREEGRPLDPRNDKNDRRMLRSALAILWTEQGRGKRYMTATFYQFADDCAEYMTHMIEGRLDIEGCFDEDYNFIQEPPCTDEQREKRAKYYNIQIDHYDRMRNVVRQKGGTVLDSFSLEATCPIMCKYTNIASRAGSKVVGSDKRSEKRAIGNNQRDYISEIFLGRYGGGAVMRELHNDVQAGTFSQAELKDLLNDPEWTYNLFNKDLADAQRADYRYALAQIGLGDIGFDALLKLGHETSFLKCPGHGGNELRHDSAYTEEQAYLAKAYYDHVCYVAQMEAALDGRFDQSLDEMIAAVRPLGDDINVSLGPQTREKFPLAVDIAAESQKNAVGTGIIRMLEDKIQTLIDQGMSEDKAVEEVGGAGFLRRAAAAWRAGTLPHWQLWAGHEKCLAHKPDPKMSLQAFVDLTSGPDYEPFALVT